MNTTRKFTDKEKWCPKCEKWLPLDDFSKKPSNQPSGRSAYCKPCSSTYNTKIYSQNPNHKAHQRDYMRHYYYGVKAEQFQELWKRQDGRCAACGDPLEVPYIDHDHACCPQQKSCGKCIRGLLCRGCNFGLGAFHDSIVRLQGAIDYLSRIKAIPNL